MLEEILKKSPTLSSLFLFGKKLSTPFKTKDVAEGEKKYEGKKFRRIRHLHGYIQDIDVEVFYVHGRESSFYEDIGNQAAVVCESGDYGRSGAAYRYLYGS
jgi:hypothetical protein